MIHERDSERRVVSGATAFVVGRIVQLHAFSGKTLRAKPAIVRLRRKRYETSGLRLHMAVTQTEFRSALGSFATGVTVITVDYEGEVHGMTANAFSSVSLDPPLVLVCVDHRARTHAHLHARKRFGVNVLAQDQQIISEYYARPAQDHRHAEQEAGAHFDRTAHGTPVLNGALAYLECRLHSAQDAGDHTIFIAEVEEVVVRGGDPLLYHRGEYRAIAVSRAKSPEGRGSDQ
jgi:flavin reductase